MAHEINIRASGKAEMAYVGELPWHGLGQPVTKGASIDVWKKESGLDWVAQEAVAQYHDDTGMLLPMQSRKVIYRSDTKHPVGMVSDNYKVVQPAEILEFFRDLTESGGWHIHTAGVLRGGSKLWAMASANEVQGSIKKNDKVKGNLLLATSLDGSMKTTAKITAVRVVCANTLALALNRHDAGTVTISHRSWFDADDVKESLGVAVDTFDKFILDANRMAEMKIDTTQARDMLRALFGQPTESEVKSASSNYEFERLMAQFNTGGKKIREQRSVSRVLELFGGAGMGSQLNGSQGTRWGLLNAITQHIDHERGRTNDTRVESSWFGKGDEIKRAALDALTAEV